MTKAKAAEAVAETMAAAGDPVLQASLIADPEELLTAQLHSWGLSNEPVRWAPDRWRPVIEATRSANAGYGSQNTVQGLLNSQFPEFPYLRADAICDPLAYNRGLTASWVLRAGDNFRGDVTVAGDLANFEGIISWGDGLAVGRFQATPAVIEHTYQGAGVFTLEVQDTGGGKATPITVTIVAPLDDPDHET